MLLIQSTSFTGKKQPQRMMLPPPWLTVDTVFQGWVPRLQRDSNTNHLSLIQISQSLPGLSFLQKPFSIALSASKCSRAHDGPDLRAGACLMVDNWRVRSNAQPVWLETVKLMWLLMADLCQTKLVHGLLLTTQTNFLSTEFGSCSRSWQNGYIS